MIMGVLPHRIWSAKLVHSKQCVCSIPRESPVGRRNGCEHPEGYRDEHVAVRALLRDTRGTAGQAVQCHQPRVQPYEAGASGQASHCGMPMSSYHLPSLPATHLLLCMRPGYVAFFVRHSGWVGMAEAGVLRGEAASLKVPRAASGGAGRFPLDCLQELQGSLR